jgi:hypothetical protein
MGIERQRSAGIVSEQNPYSAEEERMASLAAAERDAIASCQGQAEAAAGEVDRAGQTDRWMDSRIVVWASKRGARARR